MTSPPPESPPQACPPPLMWQDVRGAFLSQSERLSIPSPSGPLSVRLLGTGPALYLLPGFAAPSELYCLLIWLLRDEFRCVTVEPDWGDRQARRRSSSTLFDEARGLIAAADELGDRTFGIFGADFGAAWGLAAALRHPERVTRLILLHGFLHRRLSAPERALGWICGWSRRTLSGLPGREFVQAENQRRWFPPFDSTRWQYYLEATGEMPLEEVSRRAGAVARFDLRSQGREIRTPTLSIQTEGGGALAERCHRELMGVLPNVREEWLHNSGSLAYLTHPHRLAKLIRAFCADPALG